MKKLPFQPEPPSGFDIEGHRGCRGLYPENTIPAFLNALELGVSTLEMDVVITRDRQVLVSHDPYMSHEFCSKPNGAPIAEEEERFYNIYQMSYEEVIAYDCGLRPHPRFPRQKKMKACKPLLRDVINVSEKYQKEHGKAIGYNIEIKSTAGGDQLFHPGPEEFSDLLMEVLSETNIINKTIVQCFDHRPLRYLRNKYPSLILSLLVENRQSPEENLAALGLTPDIYSPDYILVDECLIEYACGKNMKVLPWTINDLPTIARMRQMGVYGIITDYPDLVLR